MWYNDNSPYNRKYLMLPTKNPNPWSCLPASFATVLEVQLEAILAIVGHDGSEITHVGLGEPLCRRGFHPQEMIKMCLEDGMAVSRIEIFPTSVPKIALTTSEPKQFDTGGWDWFTQNLFYSNGVIECCTAVGTGHAMAYQGKRSHALIYDPAKDETFAFRKPEDTERRDRFISALWRLDGILI